MGDQSGSAGRFKPSKTLESVAALMLLCGRLATRSVVPVWKDWLVVLALYWLFTVFATKHRTWLGVTIAAMGYLFGVYLQGTLHYLFAMFGYGS